MHALKNQLEGIADLSKCISFTGECFDIDRLSASCLGGLVLKHEQKEAVSHLLEGKDVLAVLSTGFG